MSTDEPHEPPPAPPTPSPSAWPQTQPAAPTQGWSPASVPRYAAGSSIPQPGTGYGSPSAFGGGYLPPSSVHPQVLGQLGSADGRPQLQFPRRAQSPLAPMLVYIAGAILGIIAIVASMGWIEEGPLRTTAYGRTYQNTSIPGQVYLVWFAVALIVGSLFIWWMTRIGANYGGFGPGLPTAIAFPVWLWLSAFIPVLYLVLAVVQVVWPVRLLAQGLVRGAGWPRWVALLGWVPVLTLVLSPISALFWLIVPFTITIIQHTGIHEDRRAMRAYEAAGGR